MKNFAIFLFLTLIFAIIETSLVTDIFNSISQLVSIPLLSGITINFCLIITIFYGIHKSPLEGIILTTLSAYIFDIFYPGRFAILPFFHIIMFLLIQLTAHQLNIKKKTYIIGYAITFTGIEALLTSIVYFVGDVYLDKSFFLLILPEALLNSIAIIPLHGILGYFNKATEQNPNSHFA